MRAFLTSDARMSSSAMRLGAVAASAASSPRLSPSRPVSSFGRGVLAVGSALLAARDPSRADLVASTAELTGGMALSRLRDRMKADQTGAALLRERPLVRRDAAARAARSAPGTFGAAYAHFMEHRRFSADHRPIVRFVDDEELAYVMRRYRQVHDLWHVLLDLPTTVLGELSLKWFEWAHTGLPSCWLAATVASARLPAGDQLLLSRDIAPWCTAQAAKCADLMCVRYEANFDTPLDALRRALRVDPASHSLPPHVHRVLYRRSPAKSPPLP